MRHETLQSGRVIPSRLYMEVEGLPARETQQIARLAVAAARRRMPKMTGAGARSLKPLWGNGYFGMRWDDDYVWFQEIGIHPFTMKRLAGKVIPMWIPDPTGKERAANPKAKTKRSEDGRIFVLIFRRAAKPGQRKTVTKGGVQTSVPMSYPGAPGRINRREMARPHTTVGKIAGAIGRPNVGVRWRHPGLTPRSFLHQGMITAAAESGIVPGPVYATNQRWT
jgi:hypothetical protein